MHPARSKINNYAPVTLKSYARVWRRISQVYHFKRRCYDWGNGSCCV